MKTTKDKFDLKFNFQISLIFSLILFIFLFAFYPINFSRREKIITKLFNENNITIIPATNQISKIAALPKPPKIVLGEPDFDIQILSNVTITNYIKSTKELKVVSNNTVSNYFQPRQILEVMPKKLEDDVNGYVKIKIQVGPDGKALGYKILMNTTDSEECIKEVIIAVSKSRWKKFITFSATKEYWVEKTYRFN